MIQRDTQRRGYLTKLISERRKESLIVCVRVCVCVPCWARVDLSIPLLDQILSCPSSPADTQRKTTNISLTCVIKVSFHPFYFHIDNQQGKNETVGLDFIHEELTK